MRPRRISAEEQKRLYDSMRANVRSLPAPPADLGVARKRRDAALRIVDDAANAAWRAAAIAAVRDIAALGVEFTTDDVWARLEAPPATHEPRAMGAVMQRAARAGIVEATDRTRQSARPDCHARPVRIWRPLS